jgi:hypothetical protein
MEWRLGILSPVDQTPSFLFFAFTAKKTHSATGINMGDLVPAVGAVGLHVRFVVFGIGITLFAEEFKSLVSRLLFHHRAAYLAHPLFHDSLLLFNGL